MVTGAKLDLEQLRLVDDLPTKGAGRLALRGSDGALIVALPPKRRTRPYHVASVQQVHGADRPTP